LETDLCPFVDLALLAPVFAAAILGSPSVNDSRDRAHLYRRITQPPSLLFTLELATSHDLLLLSDGVSQPRDEGVEVEKRRPTHPPRYTISQPSFVLTTIILQLSEPLSRLGKPCLGIAESRLAVVLVLLDG